MRNFWKKFVSIKEVGYMSDMAINKTHCDWIIEQAKELKALLSYESENMINLNKTRAMADISTMEDSLRELKLYLESL